jgi:hypothetical protein
VDPATQFRVTLGGAGFEQPPIVDGRRRTRTRARRRGKQGLAKGIMSAV